MEYTLENRSGQAVKGSLAGIWENPVYCHSKRRKSLKSTSRIVQESALTMLVHEPADEEAALRPDILFEDFERAGYGDWAVEGTAFGSGPVEQKRMPSYQGKVAAKGERLVNSHASAPGTGHTRKRPAHRHAHLAGIHHRAQVRSPPARRRQATGQDRHRGVGGWPGGRIGDWQRPEPPALEQRSMWRPTRVKKPACGLWTALLADGAMSVPTTLFSQIVRKRMVHRETAARRCWPCLATTRRATPGRDGWPCPSRCRLRENSPSASCWRGIFPTCGSWRAWAKRRRNTPRVSRMPPRWRAMWPAVSRPCATERWAGWRHGTTRRCHSGCWTAPF